MHPVVMLLSEQFDYAKMICADAGPGYAASLGWPHDGLSRWALYPEHTLIVDNRLTSAEAEAFEVLLHAGQIRQQVMLTVGDPYYEVCRGHWYCDFLFRCAHLPSVYYLSKYIPAETVRDLDEASGRQKLLALPYPYLASREVECPPASRSRQLLLSGCTGETLYPSRHRLMMHRRFNPFLRQLVPVLWHPGYPDQGEALTHDLIGAKYIAHLSRCRFMFLCGSRCSLEFLKYGECAYAGCVPVGYAPLSFPEDLQRQVLPLDFRHLTWSVLRLVAMSRSEAERRAQHYREGLRRERSPDVLNRRLTAFLASRLGL